MVYLLLHSVGLLLKFVELLLTGTDITLQLLNLVVEHKLELLQLLGLLLEVVNPLVFVANGGLALGEFTLLALNVGLQVLSHGDQVGELCLLIGDLGHQLFFVGFAGPVNASHLGKLALAHHSEINDCGELILVPFLDSVNLVPGLVFDLLALVFVLSKKFSNLLLQLTDLLILLLLGEGVFHLKVLKLLLLKQVQFADLV